MNDILLNEVIKIAAYFHEGQKRRGTQIPYISHPIFVGYMLKELGYDYEVIIAGILHDTLEDTSLTNTKLEYMFGKRVLSLVESVTEISKDKYSDIETKKKTWEIRKKHKLEKINIASPETKAIACMDLYSNLLDIVDLAKLEGSYIWRYFNSGKETTLKYKKDMLAILSINCSTYPYRICLEKMTKLIEELETIS